MRTTRGRWAGAIGLGVALGLVLAAVAIPDPALAGSVGIASHRPDGDGGSWSGAHRRVSPGPQWRQGNDHRGYGHGYWGDRRAQGDWGRHDYRYWGYWGQSGYWPYYHPHGWWWGAPVYVPGQWAWNGWGWVWVPGYWR